MTIPTKTIAGFVSDSIAVWQSETGTAGTFFDGDPLLAFWQSVATQMDFLQAQVQLVLALSRAQTATGGDLDSWMAQFAFVRLPANAATGQETFQRLTPSGTDITVLVGTIVQSVGGAAQYAVVPDVGNPAYVAGANGYVLRAGALSVNATIQALVAGPSDNVLANTLTQFGSSLPGIDVITNPSPITNGLAGESDASFRARFILYLATLAKATKAAITAAALGVQQGVQIALLENQQPSGQPLLGSFTVVADDGSGNPPASLITAIFAAVDATRAFSVQPFVVQPTTLLVSISMAVRITVGFDPSLVNPAVQNAVAGMVNALGPGDRLDGSAVITTALGVNGVASVNASSLAITGGPPNAPGGGVDLTPTVSQEIRTTVAAVSVSNY